MLIVSISDFVVEKIPQLTMSNVAAVSNKRSDPVSDSILYENGRRIGKQRQATGDKELELSKLLLVSCCLSLARLAVASAKRVACYPIGR